MRKRGKGEMEEEKKVRLLFSVKYTKKKTFDNTEDLSKRIGAGRVNTQGCL